jgi:hypothetical protein
VPIEILPQTLPRRVVVVVVILVSVTSLIEAVASIIGVI